VNTVEWLDSLAQDIRDGFRGMRRSPVSTLIAVVTLAIGVGVNVAVFTVTNAVLFKGFRSIDRNDRILYIGTQKDGRGCCASYPDFEDWRAQATTFQGMGAVADLQINLTDSSGAPEHYDASEVTANAFTLLGEAPILGRDFAPSDERPGAAPVAILSYGFWQRRYGTDPAIVGRTMRINGTPTTVIGVMPQGFSFPQNQDLWLPLVPTADLQKRNTRGLWFAFGRMAEGATFESARAELALIGQRLAGAYAQTNDGWVPTPRTFAQFFISVNAAMIYGSLWGAVGFLLLIACANFANLQLARAIGRRREIAVRMALGAGRGRIVRQVVTESLMLSFAGGALGWWIARWGVRGYEATANPPTRAWSEHLLDYTMDHRVLLYAVVISAATGVLFGLVPAIRLSSVDLNAGIKEGGRGATEGQSGKHLSGLLIVAQLALSVVLLTGAGAMIRSFLNLYSADLGVKTEDILTGLVNLPDQTYQGAAARLSFFDRLETRLLALPGVESVTIASAPPASGAARLPYELAGAPAVDEQRRTTVSSLTIGPAYFRTLGATLVSGREFTHADGVSGLPSVIVNDQFAKTSWPGAVPLGKRLRLLDGNTPGAWLTVVGVASNIVQDVTRQRRDPVVYVPYRQQPAGGMWVFARTRVAPGSLAGAFRREVQSLDPDLPVWIGPYPLSERLAGTGTYWSTRQEAALLLVFALVGLLLASVGLYAVIAHSVSLRTQEIGIRMAIGATAREILALVLTQGIRPMSIGLITGLAASYAVNRLLQSELVQVSATDPLTYIVTCIVLVVFGTLGCVIPARRAVRVDPVVALRHE
jgi:putative ABC transport system permease protein